MRIDHHAYQKATTVAAIGMALQAAFGLILLLFGFIANDSPSVVASMYVLVGVLLWLGLIIIFHQHKLERLEALEEDELVASRAAAGSFFDRAADETRVAARRLAFMHKWFLPVLSVVIALGLAGLAWLVFRHMRLVAADAREFHLTGETGWAVAIYLGMAGISFVFSRYVAGMAKQSAWQNLRGGAAYMVGNALVMLAVAAGIIFRFFENERVVQAVVIAIPVFMVLLALEISLNFILHLYRPRIPGEVPRPAFDSKLLSLLATPDSLVRSLNEAVNYQFGFDITSSWGYQLLLRSFVSLLALGALAMVLLSTIVIVEPHQQAVKLRFGEIVDDRVHESGVMWKWPWPFESAQVYDVTRVRSLHLTARVIDGQNRPIEERVNLWSQEAPRTDVAIEPFVVGSPIIEADEIAGEIPDFVSGVEAGTLETAETTAEDRAIAAVSDFYSLVDTEIVLQYRIRNDRNGLLDYLRFAPDVISRRQTLTDRERALRAIALAEVTRYLARLSLDDVLSFGRSNIGDDLRARVQAAFDREARRTGVEVVAVTLPMLRPSGVSAGAFEELNVSAQASRQRIAEANRNVFKLFTYHLGDATLKDDVLAAIEEFDRLRFEHGQDSAEAVAQRQAVMDLLNRGGGNAAQEIANAERDRWMTVMAKRSQSDRVQSQLASYRAAPELYIQRETMKVYREYLPYIDKYIIAINPAHVSIDADLKKISPILEFAGASEEEKKKR